MDNGLLKQALLTVKIYVPKDKKIIKEKNKELIRFCELITKKIIEKEKFETH